VVVEEWDGAIADDSLLGDEVADKRTRALLGAAAIGRHVEALIGEAALAIRAQVPLEMLVDLAHPVPTHSEAYEPAFRELLVAEGKPGVGIPLAQG
jgi:dihydrolipoamide dehydrogenase